LATTYAVPLAGWQILMSDDPVSDTDVNRWTEYVKRKRLGDAVEATSGEECLHHLLTRLMPDKHNKKLGLGEQIQLALEDPDLNVSALEFINPYGLAVISPVKDVHPHYRCLVVTTAAHHAGLNAVFHNTRWSDGAWKGALLQLDQAEFRAGQQRYGKGVRLRGAILIPPQLIMGEDWRKVMGLKPDEDDEEDIPF